MATFNNTTITGNMYSNSAVLDSFSDTTEWYRIDCCVGSGSYIHVRTPWPANDASLGWIPYMLEVVGFGGGTANAYQYDFKAIVNTSGDGNNTWYGSQVKVGNNITHEPYVYRSSSSYGGYSRMCFSIKWISVTVLGEFLFISVSPFAAVGHITKNSSSVILTPIPTNIATF